MLDYGQDLGERKDNASSSLFNLLTVWIIQAIYGEYLLWHFPSAVIILSITWPQQLSVYFAYLMMFIFLVRTAVWLSPFPQVLPANLYIQGTVPLVTICYAYYYI